ncbi:hypothetical protein BDP27DRAFT_1315830 [Rhodocollybia butyracea]|uniref:Uncharacterized protein n=1 Tax=Rhodocollybia butyracea TaxID=206335 RepID=A0A9P5UDL7_9AGAR|nr:hypothetical protein BDP27DRAFT_1315830 [Rhodocollybia butyracea]
MQGDYDLHLPHNSMTPEEQQTIAALATLAYFDNAALIIYTTGIGALALGIIVATRPLVNNPWTYNRIVLFACLLVTLITFGWMVTCVWSNYLINDRFNFAKINEQGGLEASTQNATAKALPLVYMTGWPATMNLLLSDAIVVWRAWILFQRAWFPKFGLALLTIVNIGINISNCILVNLEVTKTLGPGSKVMGWLSGLISLIVNMFATGLIALKARNHHRLMTQIGIYKRSRVQNTLLLLIESGAIYCAIQLAYTISLLINTHTSSKSGFSNIFYLISAIGCVSIAWYPVAVVILINQHNSPVMETVHATLARAQEGQPGLSKDAHSDSTATSNSLSEVE